MIGETGLVVYALGAVLALALTWAVPARGVVGDLIHAAMIATWPVSVPWALLRRRHHPK